MLDFVRDIRALAGVSVSLGTPQKSERALIMITA